MGKYDPLRPHLEQQTSDEVAFTFGEIEHLTGQLPRSAHVHRAWWANTRSHPNAVAWLDAGWELVRVDLQTKQVRFRRAIQRDPTNRTGSEAPDAAGRPATPRRDPGRTRRPDRVEALIAEFPDLLDYYDRQLPFDRSGQYALHRRTIDRRREMGSVAAAIADQRFLRGLYATLEAWGIGRRASRPVPFPAFEAELARWSPPISKLEGFEIDSHSLDTVAVGELLWDLIEGVDIIDNQARLVALSKTLHHLLPELLPPIDRMYTQEFFGFHPPQFQYAQRDVFAQIWESFVEIAQTVGSSSYVGSGWRTSRSKVIDNAIVAFVHRKRRAQR